MRRRGFIKALAAVPAVPAALGQQPPPNQPARAPNAPVQPPPSDELPNLTPSVPDAAAETNTRYFSPQQFAALRRISDILMPSLNGAPGALDAQAPEFLDFLIGQSPADRQQVYRAGLDALNQQSAARFQKPFADLESTQAAAFLEPLRRPWSFADPADPIAAFLRTAKQDVRTATVNSREYSLATGTSGARRFSGSGLYWFPLD